MSHRITVKSQMTDRKLVEQVLTAKGLQYSENNGVFRITGGQFRQATINTNSGEITGDSDYQSREVLGSLRPAYTEAKLRRQCMIDGIDIESRQEIKVGGKNVIRIITSHMGQSAFG